MESTLWRRETTRDKEVIRRKKTVLIQKKSSGIDEWQRMFVCMSKVTSTWTQLFPSLLLLLQSSSALLHLFLFPQYIHIWEWCVRAHVLSAWQSEKKTPACSSASAGEGTKRPQSVDSSVSSTLKSERWEKMVEMCTHSEEEITNWWLWTSLGGVF